MARHLAPEAVTAEEVIAVCGGRMPPEPALSPAAEPLPEPEQAREVARPPWRRLLAWISALTALVLALCIAGTTDFTALGQEQLTGGQLGLYGGLLGAMLVFALAVGRKKTAVKRSTLPPARRTLPGRTKVAAGMILLLIPLTLYFGTQYLGNRRYYVTSLLVMAECMLPFFLVYEGRKPQARELAVAAALCAMGIASRAMFFMLPQFKPVIALTIVTGVAFGGEMGFLVGAMSMLLSNMLFAQGPWTPWQMFSMGLIGFLAGLLFRRGRLRRSRGWLCLFGGLSAIVLYGGILNTASLLIWSETVSWKLLLPYLATGFPMDCVHAAATMFFLWVAGEPMLEKLDRIQTKYGLVA